MSPAPDPSGISEALSQALEVAKEGQRAQAEAADQTVEAEAADGQVRAIATLTGKVTVRIIDPRALRLGGDVLGEEISIAVNAALDAAREQAGLPGSIDLAALSEKVEEIQQQSAQRLGSFMTSLADAHSRIVSATPEGKGGS